MNLIGHIIRQRIQFLDEGLEADVSKRKGGYVGFPEDLCTTHMITQDGYSVAGWLTLAPDQAKYDVSGAAKDERLRDWLSLTELALFNERLACLYAWQAAKLKNQLGGEVVASDMAQAAQIFDDSSYILKTNMKFGHGNTPYIVVLAEGGYRAVGGQRIPELALAYYLQQKLRLDTAPVVFADNLLKIAGLAQPDQELVISALQLLPSVVSIFWPESDVARAQREARTAEFKAVTAGFDAETAQRDRERAARTRPIVKVVAPAPRKKRSLRSMLGGKK